MRMFGPSLRVVSAPFRNRTTAAASDGRSVSASPDRVVDAPPGT
jgi:hypothetical protein